MNYNRIAETNSSSDSKSVIIELKIRQTPIFVIRIFRLEKYVCRQRRIDYLNNAKKSRKNFKAKTIADVRGG